MFNEEVKHKFCSAPKKFWILLFRHQFLGIGESYHENAVFGGLTTTIIVIPKSFSREFLCLISGFTSLSGDWSRLIAQEHAQGGHCGWTRRRLGSQVLALHLQQVFLNYLSSTTHPHFSFYRSAPEFVQIDRRFVTVNDAVNAFAGLANKLYGVEFEAALPDANEMWPGEVMKLVSGKVF
jgi:hypothetical protein